ncbi:dihydrofolate reductase [Escherichia coli]|uniref:dihydrofolate reductase n=1 Tax=Escherichia coli TaxID=562 RepID=UPI000DF47FB1|nr:dihydrofolate reductase [Escherichia coli]AXF73085.1 dihydrofolate reductase [Escherichia coli]
MLRSRAVALKTKLAIKGVKLKISLISAVSENGVIGSGPDIPWSEKVSNYSLKRSHIINGSLSEEKTFDSMGVLPNRKYAVVSKNGISSSNENVLVFPSIENALKELSKVTDHVYVSGGGQIYNSLIEKADIIHLSTVHVEVEGDIKFPIMPENFNLVFETVFMSNIKYTYQIWKKG